MAEKSIAAPGRRGMKLCRAVLGLLVIVGSPGWEPAHAQTIRREFWTNITTTSVAALTASPDYPQNPAGVTFETSFEGPVNWNNYYGTRMRGYVHAPQTGEYRFWISSDDNGQLFLSSDDLAFNRTLIATVNTSTSSRQWDKEPNQQSQPVRLEAGRVYYLEALHKEHTGGDNIAVGWQLPDGTLERPIPGTRLSPYLVSTNPPSIVMEPADQRVEVGAQVEFRLSVNGAEPFYFQWQRNGADLELAIDPVLTLEAVSLDDHDSRFRCVVSNALGQVLSREARLEVSPETTPPVVVWASPPPGATVRWCGQVEVLFSEPVLNLDAADLRLNGQAATNVFGASAGPYRFSFEPAMPGPATVSWAADHGITDCSSPPNAFTGDDWHYSVDPAVEIGDVVINEFLASNHSGLRDDDGAAEDWIELHNRGTNAVSLAGWSLTDDAQEPWRWPLPDVTLGAGEYLVVVASGKDRRPTSPSGRLHTNFKLSLAGEYLGLFSPDAPRAVVSELAPGFPEQRTDIACGLDAGGQWSYFAVPTPGAPNGTSTITNVVEAPHFSVRRGFFDEPFNLHLTCATLGAAIRYTTNGSEPTLTSGLVYTNPLRLSQTTILRAAAFKDRHLPSRAATHTYFFGLTEPLQSLPVLSVVTANEHLWGPTGIMEIEPRNTTQRGLAWERPASAEWMRPEDNGGFALDCGLRIQGGNHVRARYDPNGNLPYRKYSFRLYFRGDYGASTLEYPLFPECAVDEFDTIVLRAGMNDHSNPFVVDEMVRRLSANAGLVASHGTFVNLFLNGEYKGYYNPTERIDEDFLRSWLGRGTDWDLIAQGTEVREGDTIEWNKLKAAAGRDLTVPANYLDVERKLDLAAFADYLLVNIYCGTGDWPHNNWRAARARSADARWRFLVWDAEWALGNRNRAVTVNTLTNELARVADISNFYQRLRLSPEFRLRFADRVQKHFFNHGALMDENVRPEFDKLRAVMAGVLPNMNQGVANNWIPFRRDLIMGHMDEFGLLASSNAPAFNQHGGRVPVGFELTMSAPTGTVYYTMNGADPRVAYTGVAAAEAIPYGDGWPVRLDRSLTVKARTLAGTNWSALVEADFQAAGLGGPLRITEIMYNPPGGSAYEFLELQNVGGSPVDLGGMTFEGITFQFPLGTTLAPGAVLVLASDGAPAAIAARYPGVAVAGYFNGNLANGGERLALRDAQGQTVIAVTFDDENGWPASADGEGASLELRDPQGAFDDPANWQASAQAGGSPGAILPPPPAPVVRFNELLAENLTAVPNGTNYPDWIELFNAGSAAADLSGWGLSDDGDPGKFVFPPGTEIGPGGFLVVWCDADTNAPGLHAGFALSRPGESVFLHAADGHRVDAFTFGWQLPDQSVGRFGEQWRLASPTPGSANRSAATALVTHLVLNEWLANPLPGEPDWIELHNRHPSLPVALRGLYLSNGAAVDQVRWLSFIAPGGHVQFLANEAPGNGNLSFKLPAAGSPIVLYDATGAPLDMVSNAAQAENVSRGRLPDGAATVVEFSGSASPGASNYVAAYGGPVLNELMTRNVASAAVDSQGRRADWIEFYNPGTTSFDLTGMSVSEGNRSPGEWVFPSGTVVPARGYLVVWCDNTRPASTSREPDLNLGRAMDSESGGVYLFNLAGQMVDAVEYGFQIPDLTIGRNAGEWRLLAQPTPATANAPPAALGVAGNLRVNEWLARATAGGDWFELHNLDEQPVELSGLFLSDDPSLSGRTNTMVRPLSFIAGRGFAQFQAEADAATGADQVAFALDGAGETLRLYDRDLGLIDAVDFGWQWPDVAEGRYPDGGPGILSFAGPGTPGAPNELPRTAPFISLQPQSVTVRAGTNASFAVVAAGEEPMTYQWYYSTTNALAGATAATLTLTNVELEAEGAFHVVVANPHGAVTSAVAWLTVESRPVIVQQPRSQTVFAGDTLHLTISATGTLPLGYRLRYGGNTLSNVVVAQHRFTFTLPNLQLSQAGKYTIALTNAIYYQPGVLSSQAMVTVLLDTDGDRMEDAWELACHLDPNEPQDREADPDGDGRLNWEEYICGTDPHDPASVLRVEACGPDGGGVFVRFNAVSNKTYTVEYRDAFEGGGWQKLADVPAEPTARTVEVFDPVPPTAPARCYRLVTPRTE